MLNETFSETLSSKEFRYLVLFYGLLLATFFECIAPQSTFYTCTYIVYDQTYAQFKLKFNAAPFHIVNCFF